MATVTQQLDTNGRLYPVAKRWLDAAGAFVLLVLLSPVLVLVAIAVRVESAGPAVYRQKRVGRCGKGFVMLKFRSMKIGTPVLSTEDMQKQQADPYTRIGRFLRKSNLDEFPQLWNVLKGEMSFIGPRPALPTQEDVLTLREEVGADRVRPGITGLAQAMGRDDLDNRTKVSYDGKYCRELSFPLDLRIIFLTFAAVLSARGNK